MFQQEPWQRAPGNGEDQNIGGIFENYVLRESLIQELLWEEDYDKGMSESCDELENLHQGS